MIKEYIKMLETLKLLEGINYNPYTNYYKDKRNWLIWKEIM